MVDGEIGQSGTNVLLVAVVVTKEGQDRAITQRHNSEATIVPLMAHQIWNLKHVMKTLAQVRTDSYLHDIEKHRMRTLFYDVSLYKY